MRENDDGWTCVGDTATGYMGLSNRRVVLRCSPEHFQQHISLIRLAVSAMFAIDVVHGKFNNSVCHFVSTVASYIMTVVQYEVYGITCYKCLTLREKYCQAARNMNMVGTLVPG